MAIEVACVMAAGQAGLKSIPYFVDEFIARGIRQLVPRPFDHDNVQIEQLGEEFRANWTKDVLYGMGESRQLATKIGLNAAFITRILGGVNPVVAKEMGSTFHDSPARLAAWCRLALKDECRETLQLWDTYKNLNGLGLADQLAVVIPFCPEGPTSGTVGMYLGATMIECCREDRRNDVIVWGVELCPPAPTRLAGDPARNVFRGYVAREEMLGGVPLSADDPDDADRKQCFHINIAFDGGYSPRPYTGQEDILPALDRAAAQGIACLLTVSGPPDKGEIVDALRKGTGRWNAFVVNVVCETSYSPALRCLGYRGKLPWNRNAERWAKRKTGQKKEAFLARIDEIGQLIADEEVPEVKAWFAQLNSTAEQLRTNGGIGRFFSKKEQEMLLKAERDDDDFYRKLLAEDRPNDRVMVRSQPFCVNVGLTEQLREDNAQRIVDPKDPGHSKPLSEMLGIASSNGVQSAITDFCKQFLDREEWDANAPSRANFEDILAMSVRSDANRLNAADFCPTDTALRAYLDANTRERSLPYFLWHDTSNGKDGYSPLRWKPFKVDQANNDRKSLTEHEVPVEYGFIALARVRNSEGFRDLYSYSDLKKQHDSTVNSADWLDHARYYTVRVPEKLLRQWEQQKRI